MSGPPRPKVRVWRAPVILAVLTASGLGSALIGPALARWLAWIALAIPLAVAVPPLWGLSRRRSRPRAAKSRSTGRW